MSQGEAIISFLLILIVYFLYQIARQLTLITGRKMRLPQVHRTITQGIKKQFMKKRFTAPDADLPTKLPN